MKITQGTLTSLNSLRQSLKEAMEDVDDLRENVKAGVDEGNDDSLHSLKIRVENAMRIVRQL